MKNMILQELLPTIIHFLELKSVGVLRFKVLMLVATQPTIVNLQLMH